MRLHPKSHWRRLAVSIVLPVLVAMAGSGSVFATAAIASRPEFKTRSGKTLSFTDLGGLARLAGERSGVEGEIHCEKSKQTGEVLNNSSLAVNVNVDFYGKCEANSSVQSKAACVEPIFFKESKEELGLVGGLVALYLAPLSGEEFAVPDCGGESTTIKGAIVGLFPETSKYNVLEEEALLTYRAKGVKQEPTEIELLGTNMTGVELKVEGLFTSKASLANEAKFAPDGEVEIVTDEEKEKPISKPEFVTESGDTLSFHAAGGLAQLFGERLGVVGELHCEASLATGEILNGTPLIDNVLFHFSGKCVQNSSIGKNESCVEPLLLKPLRWELGVADGLVALLLAPANGSEIYTTDCGGEETTLDGAVVGLFPESSKYNKLESSTILEFKSKETSQQDTEIELLGTKMTDIHLTATGLFGGNAALSASMTITPDGRVEIKT